MFFILSKTFGFISVPSNVFVMIGLAGISLLPSRFAGIGRRLLVASVILIAAIGTLPVGDRTHFAARGTLSTLGCPRGAPAGNIVIGGAIIPEISDARGKVSLDEAAERVTVQSSSHGNIRWPGLCSLAAMEMFFPGRLKLTLLAAFLKTSECHEIGSHGDLGREIRRKMQFSPRA